MSFCETCGNLMQIIRNAETSEIRQFCSKCSDIPDKVIELINDEPFLEKLKKNFRIGREEKPLRSLARILNIPEMQLHEVLKELDNKGLPYGYYDKIEKVYIRTHLTEDISEELLIDMVVQSYGYEIFGAKGLTNYISLGKQTSVRKILQSLHEVRRKGLMRGFKKGNRWLWRHPRPGESSNAPFFPKKKEIETEEPEDLDKTEVPESSSIDHNPSEY